MSGVIVTGVNGFVGRHLARELAEYGWGVIGVGHDSEAVPSVKSYLSEYISCDLTDYDKVALLPLERVRAVINLAGLAAVGTSFEQPDFYMHVNTTVLDTICKAATQQQAKNLRILAISSGAVYGSRQSMPLTEDSSLVPESSPYAASKIAMEELAMKYREGGLECIVARPFNHIGPAQGEGFLLPDLYKKITEIQASNEKFLVGNITSKRDYTDVRDVARAYVVLISQNSVNHGVYNVCSGKSVSGKEILDILARKLGYENLQPEVDQKLFRPSDAPDLFGDNSRIRTETGWTPIIRLEQTIEDFVNSKRSTSSLAGN